MMSSTKSRSRVDLDGRGRQRRLAIFTVTGAALLLSGATACGLGGGDGRAQAAARPSPTGGGDATAWFEGTALVRGDVMEAATAVRTYVETEDGLALQPACTKLGTKAATAEAHPDAPVTALRTLWVSGASEFASAADWCAKLWDGTPMAPPAILVEVTGALDEAEASWEALANLAGQPLPVLPSGTLPPVDGGRGSSSLPPSQNSTPTPVTPPATANSSATPSATPAPDSVLPSITLPTFGTPSPPAAATITTPMANPASTG